MQSKTKVSTAQSKNAEQKQDADMDHASFIIGSYVLTIISVAAYAISILRRGRKLGAITSDDDKPWI